MELQLNNNGAFQLSNGTGPIEQPIKIPTPQQ